MNKSILKLASIAFIGSLLGRGLRYSMNIVIARGLGLEALGLFAFGMVVMKALGVFARFGLNTATQKYIPIYTRQEDTSRVAGVVIFALSFPFILGGSLSIALLIGFRTTNLGSEFSTTVQLFLVGVPLVASMMVGMNATTGFKETRYSVYIRDIIQSGTAILLVSVGAYVFGSLELTIYGYILSLGIGLISAIYYLNHLGAFEALPTFEVREIMVFSAPVVIVAVSQYVVSWTDILMLGAFVSPTEVGWYQAAYQTSILLVLVLSAVNSIFPTIASDLYSEGRLDELEVMYTAVTKWVTYLTILGFVFVSVYASEILGLFNTTEQSAQTALIILAFGQAITASTGPVGFILTMSGNERLESFNTTILAVLNIGLNFVLIQEYGIVGAAIATAFSLLTLNLVRLAETQWILGIQPYGLSYWKGGVGILAATVLMFIGHAFVAGSLFRTVAVGCSSLLLFAGIVALLGFDETDAKLIGSLR